VGSTHCGRGCCCCWTVAATLAAPLPLPSCFNMSQTSWLTINELIKGKWHERFSVFDWIMIQTRWSCSACAVLRWLELMLSCCMSETLIERIPANHVWLAITMIA
jgi:hypothetical protein